MFGLRCTIDCTPRTKNGQPAHSTIGSDSASSTHVCVDVAIQPSRCPNIASTVTTIVSGSVHQKRRRKSRNSGLSSSSSSGITGSSAMPHLGSVPDDPGGSPDAWGTYKLHRQAASPADPLPEQSIGVRGDVQQARAAAPVHDNNRRSRASACVRAPYQVSACNKNSTSRAPHLNMNAPLPHNVHHGGGHGQTRDAN